MSKDTITKEVLETDSTVQVGKEINWVDKQCAETVYCTPDYLAKALRDYYGGEIPFDAATLASNPLEAVKFCTEKQDGLLTPWEPRTFVNPPYGEEISAWTEKIHLEAAGQREVIALLPCGARFSTNYWQWDILASELDVILFVKGRVGFLDARGEQRKQNPYDSAFYGFNVDVRRFCACMGHLGKIVIVAGVYYRPDKNPLKRRLADRYAAT